MTNAFESVRVSWSATDEQFFRIAAELFSSAYLQGASVLLGSYDDEVAATTDAFAPARGAPRSPAGDAVPARSAT